jgi:hypothetical protein
MSSMPCTPTKSYGPRDKLDRMSAEKEIDDFVKRSFDRMYEERDCSQLPQPEHQLISSNSKVFIASLNGFRAVILL